MLEIGYHASHEQFPPGDLREYVGLAEDRGFDAVGESITREQVRRHVSADVADLRAEVRALREVEA